MKLIKSIFQIFKREIRLIRSDKDIIIILLLSPLFYALFYSSVYLNKDKTDIPLTIVNMDNSSASRLYTKNLDAHRFIEVKEVIGNFEKAKESVMNLESFGVLYIPADFETELKKSKGADIKVFLNNSRFLLSNNLNRGIQEVTAGLNYGVRYKYFRSLGYSDQQAKKWIEPIRAEVNYIPNTANNYGGYIIPSVLILVLMMTLAIGFAMSIAKEREENSFETLMKSGISTVFFGKSLFYIILYLAYSLVFYSVIFSEFQLRFGGSFILVLLVTALFFAAVSSFTYFAATFFNRKIFALQFLALSSYPIFFLSGYSFPLESMPVFIKNLALLNPLTPYIDSFVRLGLMDADFRFLFPQIIHLILLAIAGFTLAYIRIKFFIKKN